jgi:hypothetical protein
MTAATPRTAERRSEPIGMRITRKERPAIERRAQQRNFETMRAHAHDVGANDLTQSKEFPLGLPSHLGAFREADALWVDRLVEPLGTPRLESDLPPPVGLTARSLWGLGHPCSTSTHPLIAGAPQDGTLALASRRVLLSQRV